MIQILKVREKVRYLTQSFDKSSYTHRKIQKSNVKTRRLHSYTAIADQLRAVSWGNDSHPTDVVTPVCGTPIFPLTAKVVYLKGHTFKNL